MDKKLCFIIPLLAFVLFLNCAGTQNKETTNQKTAKIELDFNSSIGDMYELVISPEGVVRDASQEYRNGSNSRPNEPSAVGAWGKYTVTFEAVSEGEAEIVVYNHFRFSATGKKVITYKAVVDSENNLTLTVLEYHGDGRRQLMVSIEPKEIYIQPLSPMGFAYNKDKGFKPSVIIDKEGKKTLSLKTGTHIIAVKVVDNDGLENTVLHIR